MKMQRDDSNHDSHARHKRKKIVLVTGICVVVIRENAGVCACVRFGSSSFYLWKLN